MGFKVPKDVPEWMRPDRHTVEKIEQAAKLQRQIDEAIGANGRAALAAYDQQAKHQQMLKDIGFIAVPDFQRIPDAVEWQRGEERRRLRMAEEEGEAKARAEFKTRQELEAAHQKELQATAVTEPPPAPASESISDRNARWLAIFDQEERSKHKGAQTRTCERVSKQEGIKPYTVKAALQRAKKERAERIRQGGAIPLPRKKGKPQITANNPFGLATKKR